MADRELNLKLVVKADGTVAVSREVGNLASELDRAGRAAGKSGEQLDKSNAKTQKAQTLYQSLVSKLTLSNKEYRAQELALKGLTQEQIRHIDALETEAEKANKVAASLQNAKTKFVDFGKGLLAAFGVKLGFDLVGDIVRTNAEMESLRKTLESVTGSAEAAQVAFDDLQQFAVDTPYEIKGLTEAFISLQNYGINPTREVMQAITDQASKLGASQETLSGIVTALGQAWAKGKLQAEEMMQLAERGVPVYDILAQALGKSTAELFDMAQKGELTRDVIAQLITKMGELAKGSNARAMDTLNGKISNLSDAWHRFEDTLLNDKSEGLIKKIVDGATATLELFRQEMSDSLDDQIASIERKLAYRDFGVVGKAVYSVANIFSSRDQKGQDDNERQLAALKKQKAGQDEQRRQLQIKQQSAAAIKETQAWLDDIDAQSAESAKKNAKGKASAARAALQDARQIAQAELQIQTDKIARIEQLSDAAYAADIARAEQHAAEKLAQANGDKQAELLIEQELADEKSRIQREQAQVAASFAEQRLTAELSARRRELALTSDRGEQAKINAEIVRIEQQLQTERELSVIAAQQLAAEEAAASAERLRAQQAMLDQVILKYDLQAARMREFDADAAIVNRSNLPLERKRQLLDEIAKAYAKAGEAAKESENQAEQFAENAARNIQSSFADFLFQPFDDGLKGMLRGFIEVIHRILAEAVSADILAALGLGGKDNNGGNSQALVDKFTGLFGGGADEVAQVAANEAAKTEIVVAGETARQAAVTTGAAAKAGAVATGQATETSAVIAGETARQTAESAGQSKSLLTVLTNSAKKIHAYAAEAAAGAYAAFASIQYVGPVLGAVAAAVTYAAVMAFGALTGGAAFAQGGRVDGTSGGRISGPGTPTSDSVPIWGSDKEGILKAKSLEKLDQKYGKGLFDYLNAFGDLPPSMKAMANNAALPQLNIPEVKFNAGGRVNASLANSANTRSDSPNIDNRTGIRIVNVVDPSLVHDAMSGSSGTRIIMNALSTNPGAARQALELS